MNQKQLDELRERAHDAIACGEPRQLMRNLNHQFYYDASPQTIFALLDLIQKQQAVVDAARGMVDGKVRATPFNDLKEALENLDD